MNPTTANPPASHPPQPPPPSSGEGEASDIDPLIPPSYQNQQQGGRGRAAAPPTIRHYDGTNEIDYANRSAAQQQQQQPSEDVRDFFFVRGDATLAPNTGQTNSYDYAIFGLALHELLENIRLANMISAFVAIGLLVVSWIVRLLTGQVARLVLSSYLAFLSVVLLLVEATSMWHYVPADAFLRDNFGLVRHPVGKTIYIYTLSTICFGIGGVPEFVLGALYFVCASLLLYAWCLYPEFRRMFADEDDDEDSREQPPEQAAASWSDYANSFSSFKSTGKQIGERASLLGSTLRK